MVRKNNIANGVSDFPIASTSIKPFFPPFTPKLSRKPIIKRAINIFLYLGLSLEKCIQKLFQRKTL